MLKKCVFFIIIKAKNQIVKIYVNRKYKTEHIGWTTIREITGCSSELCTSLYKIKNKLKWFLALNTMLPYTQQPYLQYIFDKLPTVNMYRISSLINYTGILIVNHCGDNLKIIFVFEHVCGAVALNSRAVIEVGPRRETGNVDSKHQLYTL